MGYKNRIIRFNKNRNYLLMGVRGSGKTHLLKKIFPSALYIDLLNQSTYGSYLSNISKFYEQIHSLKTDSVIIVDEIQKICLNF